MIGSHCSDNVWAETPIELSTIYVSRKISENLWADLLVPFVFLIAPSQSAGPTVGPLRNPNKKTLAQSAEHKALELVAVGSSRRGIPCVNISASDGPLQSKPHASIQAQSKSYTRYTDSEGLPEGCQAVNHGAMPQEHGVEANWPHRYRPRSRAANLNENFLRSRCTSIVLLLDDSGHVQFLLRM